jgi:nucleoside-diphosphate-sugar epimerase
MSFVLPQTAAPGLRTVLILGAAGRLGYAVTQAFSKAGWRVVAQARRTPEMGWPAGVEHTATPLQETDKLCTTAGPTTRAVVYAVNPLLTRWSQDLLPWAHCGMDVAQRLDALFMLPGNVYPFGQGMPPEITAQTPVSPTTTKGRLRADLEAQMQARCAQGLRSTVVRAGDFFGSGRGSWLDLVISKSLQQGLWVYPGPLAVQHAWAYLPDLARAFVRLAEQDDLPVFSQFQFAGHAVTGEEFLTALTSAATTLGLSPANGFKRGEMPWRWIRWASVLVPLWRELVEMEYLWRVPHALDGRDLQRQIGALPGTPLVQALTQSLKDLGHACPTLHSATAVG